MRGVNEPRRRVFTRALTPLAAALVTMLGCGDDQSPSNKCVAPVAISIGEGTQPVVSWQPQCLAFSVSVVPTAAAEFPTPVWQAISPVGILPPVTVGDSPPQAYIVGAENTLMAGTEYKVYVSRGAVNGDPNGRADSLTFTVAPEE